MDEKSARAALLEAVHKLVDNKLVSRTWGNISIKLDEEYFLITPSGRSYETMKTEDLVKVRIEDCSYEGPIKPSSEKGLHAECYKQRKEVTFVVHTHQTYASVLSINEKNPLYKVAPYGLPGTKKLVKAVSEALKANPADKFFLLKSHGALALGENSEEAFSLALDAEKRCREQLLSTLSLSSFAYTESRIEKEKSMLKGYPYAAVLSGDVIKRATQGKREVLPALDDMAQLAGSSLSRDSRGHNAMLLSSGEVLVYSLDEEDLKALGEVVFKGLIAELYRRSESLKPLGYIDRALQRFVYLKKYSKQKGK